MTTFFMLESDPFIFQSLLLQAKQIAEMPDNYLRDSAVQHLLMTARRHKLDGLNIIQKAMSEAQPKAAEPKPQLLQQAQDSDFACPNCKRTFKSQQALKGHRPHKCNA